MQYVYKLGVILNNELISFWVVFVYNLPHKYMASSESKKGLLPEFAGKVQCKSILETFKTARTKRFRAVSNEVGLLALGCYSINHIY